MKKVLITGANSYIGESFEKWVTTRYPEEFQVETVDMIGNGWREKSFEGYDAVFHVAGIAHQKETEANAPLYYKVNRDLAIETAKKAKESGVKQFVLLSSMSVYGKTVGIIKKTDMPDPKSHYGKAKWQADKAIEPMSDQDFKVAILRPPMVYGKGCKGNYQTLRKVALKSPVFPDYKNQRSMVYIDNLCEFVKNVINNEEAGLFFPQNEEYVCTSEMVTGIAEINNKKMYQTKIFNILIKLGIYKVSVNVLKKVFGNLKYEKVDTVDIIKFKESIKLCEE